MREALRILLGNEVENLVWLGFAKDGSSVCGSDLLIITRTKSAPHKMTR